MQRQHSFSPEPRETGVLYVVGTPIGNLEDMTFRAVRILREVDCIAAEDTRQTRKLLSHFGISARELVSYHEHNKKTSGPGLIRRLQAGKNIALVSDAGMPAISDPGCDLVREALAAGIAVIPVPGANAALTALSVSGLPTDSFYFAGFLPRGKKELQTALSRLQSVEATLIFYEAPHRIRKTLEAMYAAWGDRRMALARELTKKYEEIARGLLSECITMLAGMEPRGEYCIVVEGSGLEASDVRQRDSWWAGLALAEHVAYYEQTGYSRMEAMKRAARDRGISKRDAYRELHQKD